ncbi:Tripartite motif-containing protein 3 [Geodia barretti]|uniref:Tripartite motif-containing protein 3 n=1 Tax=Geodia barretti TaxID=519541 RepID=A0AA35X121_GEOBA|nr:Tripartite motif-containing protein 3 [Geodia barretti]
MAEKPQATTEKPGNLAQEALEKLSNQLSCSVCLEEYRRPRVLPCLHVFCEACLEKLVGTQRDKLSALCPNCRKPATLPQGGVSSLPSAFYIQHLFEVREVLEKVRDPEKAQCDKCGEGEVQGFCRDCGQFICQHCLITHRKWRELQGHEISTIDQVQETASKMVTPKKVSSVCSKHTTEPIKIYCETCDELICRDCTVKTHRDHNYDLVPDTFPKHRDAILACLGPVKSELASVGGTIVGLKARSSRLDGQDIEAKAQVDAEVDNLQAILEARRRELHSQIDGEVCQGKKELAARIDGHELRQAQLSSCVEFVEGSLQSGTQEEVLSMKRQVEERAREMADEFKPQQLVLGLEKEISVVCADLSSACQTLGEVKFETVQLKGTHVETISEIKHPRHSAFAKTGETIVCERNANCMKVFDSNHRLLRLFGNTESRLIAPTGVAISSDNTVFVVGGNHCVMKFTLEGQFIASVGSKGSGQLQFNTPYATAYNHTNNRVYICDTCNHRITILNNDLTFHDNFGSRGSEAGQFNRPRGISVSRKGNVFVADCWNNRVQIFDANGRHLSSITHTGAGEGLGGPVSVAVGPDDWVYVVEYDYLRVSVFDENGKYVKSFGKRGNKDGEFKNPFAIAVRDDGYVFVSDTFNDRVQIFK